MKFKDRLKNLKACSAAIEWVGSRTAASAWKECKRGDWILWLIDKSNPKITLAMRRKLVLCACDIAETSLKHVPAGEKRPAEALRVARAWARGEKVSLDEVKTAAYAAYAAYAAAYAAYAAANAANAAYAAANAAAYADIVRKYFPKPPKF
jgi:hypothetical protein